VRAFPCALTRQREILCISNLLSKFRGPFASVDINSRLMKSEPEARCVCCRHHQPTARCVRCDAGDGRIAACGGGTGYGLADLQARYGVGRGRRAYYPNNTIPRTAVPAVPIPVQIAQAVPAEARSASTTLKPSMCRCPNASSGTTSAAVDGHFRSGPHNRCLRRRWTDESEESDQE
jgi:hypothetical protein